MTSLLPERLRSTIESWKTPISHTTTNRETGHGRWRQARTLVLMFVLASLLGATEALGGSSIFFYEPDAGPVVRFVGEDASIGGDGDFDVNDIVVDINITAVSYLSLIHI